MSLSFFFVVVVSSFIFSGLTFKYLLHLESNFLRAVRSGLIVLLYVKVHDVVSTGYCGDAFLMPTFVMDNSPFDMDEVRVHSLDLYFLSS